ncbi:MULTISPECIES: hypothetical protein [Nostoc]|uniref:Uncharacterized protein n=1 Tax=Nostoc paludosum FACHB-159 TaxID=2692908 RepID=A0ABR8K4Q8_9NOSO|nr:MULTISPECIES: hypothetical protein [Nostoc]MBD2677776.1 hypothetical protein [Nostoc sp. FACHB-857]MBD2734050.1 hypothetical protein [Nostoc paludosum FACHB-159]
MKATIRLANENDASQMLLIYAPIVQETTISFELEAPSETVSTTTAIFLE